MDGHLTLNGESSLHQVRSRLLMGHSEVLPRLPLHRVPHPAPRRLSPPEVHLSEVHLSEVRPLAERGLPSLFGPR